MDKPTSEILDADHGIHGLSLAVRLFHEYETADPIVIAAPSPDAVGFRGSAFFSVAFRSDASARMEAASANVPFGYSMRRLGLDAIVIIGRARHLTGIHISEAGAEFMEAGEGLSSREWAAGARKNISDTYLAIGPAGENGVVFASLQSPVHDIQADGLGFLFGRKNLKGIILPSFQRNETYSGSRRSERIARRIERSALAKRFRKEGECLVIDEALRLRWLPVDYYGKCFDPRGYFLDGKAFSDKFGIFPQSCQDCFFSCCRRTKDDEMLPGYQECIMLGTNLGFFSPESVLSLFREASACGLDAVHLGALLGYISENELEDYSLPHPRKGRLEEYIRAIRIASRGQTRLSKGLKAFPEAMQSGWHHPITADLRGDYASAISASTGLPDPLISRMLPRHQLSAESAATVFLYEKVIAYGLLSEGFSPVSAAVLWWRFMPAFLYRFPSLIRLFMLSASLYGIRSHELIRRGYGLLRELEGGEREVPQHFLYDADGLGRSVPFTRLMAHYRSEKLRLENALRLRSEIRLRPRSSRRAAEGPAEDLGRDGDPGLQK